MSNCATLGGHVHLGDWVIMGGFSGVHQFTKVGAHAFIANNAAVTRDVPPFIMAVGQPAQPHSINSEGLKRRGFTEQQIRNLRNAYKVLYRSDLRLEEAVERLKEMAASHTLAVPANYSANVRSAVAALAAYQERQVLAGRVTLEQTEVAFLLRDPVGRLVLMAISLGAVFFGAMTYIGNGPNFMVKSIADSAGIKTPGFIKYIFKFALPILLPVYVVVWLVFFR